MLIYRILCAAAFIAVGRTEIPYDRVDLKIINNEEKLRQTMKEINEVYKDQAIGTGTRVAFALSGVFPILGVSAALIPILIDAVRSSGREKAFANAISDGAKKQIVKQEIRKLEAKIVTIDENIKLLKSESNSGTRFKPYEKKCIVLIIHNALKEIINDFAHPKSIFKEYPTLALQPLFAFTTFIAVYDGIEKALHPALGSLPISCKFFDILLEYRSVVVRYRLTRLEIFERKSNPNVYPRALKREMFDVLDRSFNQYGYNKTNKGGEHWNLYKEESCLIDRSSGVYYNAGQFSISCVRTYIQLLRHRIEKAFKEPLDLADLVCPEKRRKQRKPTGYGWLTINIEKVGTMNLRCDTFMKFGDLCDPYVKIIFDGKEVHKTETITNTDVAYFLDTYNSQKINKSTKIIFEIWDEDGDLAGGDDRLFNFHTDIPKLLENTEKKLYKFSYISWKSAWRDDYE